MINKQKQYGLIGFPLSHSFSPAYFRQKFTAQNIHARYDLFPLTSIEAFPSLIQENSFSGLNVTIPYKEQIIPYLDCLSSAAAQVGAVNCIAFEKGQLKGYNTDVMGFELSLKKDLAARKTALILGTGGAAKAVAYVLDNLAVSYQFVSRKEAAHCISYEKAQQEIPYVELIVNTTPLGMHPHLSASPLTDFSQVNKQHLFYDLIYNPKESLFLSKAKAKGAKIKNGLEMLELQAEESWAIWASV